MYGGSDRTSAAWSSERHQNEEGRRAQGAEQEEEEERWKSNTDSFEAPVSPMALSASDTRTPLAGGPSLSSSAAAVARANAKATPQQESSVMASSSRQDISWEHSGSSTVSNSRLNSLATITKGLPPCLPSPGEAREGALGLANGPEQTFGGSAPDTTDSVTPNPRGDGGDAGAGVLSPTKSKPLAGVSISVPASSHSNTARHGCHTLSHASPLSQSTNTGSYTSQSTETASVLGSVSGQPEKTSVQAAQRDALPVVVNVPVASAVQSSPACETPSPTIAAWPSPSATPASPPIVRGITEPYMGLDTHQTTPSAVPATQHERSSEDTSLPSRSEYPAQELQGSQTSMNASQQHTARTSHSQEGNDSLIPGQESDEMEDAMVSYLPHDGEPLERSNHVRDFFTLENNRTDALSAASDRIARFVDAEAHLLFRDNEQMTPSSGASPYTAFGASNTGFDDEADDENEGHAPPPQPHLNEEKQTPTSPSDTQREDGLMNSSSGGSFSSPTSRRTDIPYQPAAMKLFNEYVRNSRKAFIEEYYGQHANLSSSHGGGGGGTPLGASLNTTQSGNSITKSTHSADRIAYFSGRKGRGAKTPHVTYARVKCVEGEAAIAACVEPQPRDTEGERADRRPDNATKDDDTHKAAEDGGENVRAPSMRALKNLAAMTYGPFNWGTRHDQCRWILENLNNFITTGSPATILRVLLTISYLIHYGSNEMLEVMHEYQDDVFDPGRLQERNFNTIDSSVVSLIYIYGGFITSVADFMHMTLHVKAEGKTEAVSHSSSTSETHRSHASQRGSDETLGKRDTEERTESPSADQHPLGGADISLSDMPLPLSNSTFGHTPGLEISSSSGRQGEYAREPMIDSLMGSSASAAAPTTPGTVGSAGVGRGSLLGSSTNSASSSKRFVKDGFLTGNILQAGTYEHYLGSLSRAQGSSFLLACFEILKGATTVQYLDLQPGRLSPVEEFTIASYIISVRALFTSITTIVEDYLEIHQNPYFSAEGLTPEEQLRRTENWCVSVIGYEATVWRLSKLFSWAASLRLQSRVRIPKLRPLPLSFVSTLKNRLLQVHKGLVQESVIAAALADAKKQQTDVLEMQQQQQRREAGQVTNQRRDEPRREGPSAPTQPQVKMTDTAQGENRRNPFDSDSDVEPHEPFRALKALAPSDSQEERRQPRSHAHGQNAGQRHHRDSTPLGGTADLRVPVAAAAATSTASQALEASLASAASGEAGSGVGVPSPRSVSVGHSVHPVDLSEEFYNPNNSQPSVDSSTGSEAEISQLIHRKRKQHFMVIADDADVRSASDASRFRVFRNEILGRGSFGVVYKCWDDAKGHFLACKEMTLDADTATEEQTMTALFREYSLLTSLRHPNIVGVVGFLVEGQKGRIFMEWMPSGSLQSVMELLHEGMREGVVRRFLRDALRGLEYLHAKGIVHRDVKPGNMLLGADGVLKLTDFGSSRSVLQGSASAGATLKTFSVVGTLAYIAPDSVRGYYSYASDIWSLGCSAIHMVTGKPPWGNAKMESVGLIFKIGSLTEEDHLPAIENRDQLSPALIDFIEKALTFDRHKRPTARELLEHPFITGATA